MSNFFIGIVVTIVIASIFLSVIAPHIFGVQGIPWMVGALLFLLVYFGPSRWTIPTGLLVALIFENILLLPAGDVALPFFVTALFVLVAGNFVAMRPMPPHWMGLVAWLWHVAFFMATYGLFALVRIALLWQQMDGIHRLDYSFRQVGQTGFALLIMFGIYSGLAWWLVRLLSPARTRY